MTKTEAERLARAHKQLELKIKELEAKQEEIEQTLKAALEAEGLEVMTTKTFAINWKWTHSHRFDSKTFKAEHIDLYNAYQVPSDYRKFAIV